MCVFLLGISIAFIRVLKGSTMQKLELPMTLSFSFFGRTAGKFFLFWKDEGSSCKNGMRKLFAERKQGHHIKISRAKRWELDKTVNP